MNKNIFNSIKLNRPKRNRFDLTHDVKLTLDMGTLVPTLALECIPGDSFNIGCDSLVRFSPLIAPVMQRFNMYMHYFFVPNRLLWKNWENFISPSNGETLYAAPYINYTKIQADNPQLNYLADYLGIPVQEVSAHDLTLKVSALPFAAYQLIFKEYYRDQNLVPDSFIACVDGANPATASFLGLKRRAWEHDYFTSCLPFAQKGQAVEIPLGEFQDIPVLRNQAGDDNITWDTSLGANTQQAFRHASDNPDLAVNQLYADTSELVDQSTTINDLRRAFRLQEWLERNARAGTRYVESILAHFGVKSPDARLQRPEYITGTKSPVVVSEVLNTTGEVDGLPQGNMAGHGFSSQNGKYGKYFCQEHGWIIGIMSVLPRTAYYQGLAKQFSKFDTFDYFWPSFANIGEQEVKNSEVYVNSSDPDGTFGYVPRYAEYRYMPSRVCGAFRTSLDYWHDARKFDTEPALNSTFINSTPSKRIFAVESATEGDSLYAHVLHKISAVRPIPMFGTPSF